ncbi:MAG: hypothetical protein KDI48_06390 [Xanthomonadales bacterium]|nr:hypothetical protein [Xanthomonadales bacterium]
MSADRGLTFVVSDCFEITGRGTGVLFDGHPRPQLPFGNFLVELVAPDGARREIVASSEFARIPAGEVQALVLLAVSPNRLGGLLSSGAAAMTLQLIGYRHSDPKSALRWCALALASLGIAGAAAGAQPAVAIATSPCLDVQRTNPLAYLSERERCQMERLVSRCALGDACVVECLVNERHRDRLPDGAVRLTGGGCEHICHGYDDTWQPPSDYTECARLPADLPDGEIPTDLKER